MIQSLTVHNYALINKLEINFMRGLSTITGETGAGKSILIGALSLVLGNRADSTALKDKTRKCFVEAEFVSNQVTIMKLFAENEIDPEEVIILRREIAPNGKSRAFINDTPVSLQVLKDVGFLLVDIHSQHENLNLNNNLYQLGVVDAFAGNTDLLDEYYQTFEGYTTIDKELAGIRENSTRTASEIDFLKYQLNELEQVKLVEGEQEELEAELEVLTHAEEIKSGLYSVIQSLSGEEINSEKLLKEAGIILARVGKIHAPSDILRQRIESILIEIRDIDRDTRSMYEKVEEDPVRIGFVRERLNILYSLQKKYRVNNLAELIRFRNELVGKLEVLSAFEFRAEDLEKEKQALFNKLNDMADSLSLKRKKTIPAIQEKVISMLVQMGIPNARFEIRNIKSEEPGLHGKDNIRFFFTANRKTELQDISRIASGGELSRLMLSIKSIISGTRDLPTIIFDEIDAGVSGEIAFKVGKILKEMSAGRQVFAITHLPQVAAKGDHHFLVYKKEKDIGTTTEIKLLSANERIIEIAKLLSGEQTTEAAMANARELLS